MRTDLELNEPATVMDRLRPTPGGDVHSRPPKNKVILRHRAFPILITRLMDVVFGPRLSPEMEIMALPFVEA